MTLTNRGNVMVKSFIALAALGVVSTAAIAQSAPTPLTYRGNPVNGYLGGTPDFPAAFKGTPLCESGAASSDSRNACVLLNDGGTGTWENDRAPGRQSPAGDIKWYLVADQKGTVTRVGDEQSDTWFLIFEFTSPHSAFKVGDMIAFPARRIKGSPGRVVIDSKYRNMP
jgi:hypothetical protein